MTQLVAVYPISDEDVAALPVRALGRAIAFYEARLGFTLVARETGAATVARDGVRIGLVRREDHEPARAGSLAVEVDDLDALHRELAESGAHPGAFGVDEWAGAHTARSSCARTRTGTATASSARSEAHAGTPGPAPVA
jgi:catechol 2,3-dioxygenase-like lactoylglutathione lyase family enzyme